LNPAARQLQTFGAAQAAQQAALSNISNETGGRAFFNTNGLKEAFAKAVDQGSHYYTLAYRSSNPNFDGKLRRIRVEAGKGSYQLAYRRSYFADDPSTVGEGVDTLAVALKLGTPVVEDLPFISHVTAGQPEPPTPEQLAQLAKFTSGTPAKQSDVARDQVDFGLVARSLTRIAGPDGASSVQLEFAAFAYGADGRLLNGIRTKVNRTISADKLADLEKSGFHTRLTIDVPVDAKYLRLGVSDDLGNRIGALELRLPLAPEAAAAPAGTH
jgi:hypothetical protein